MRNQDLVGVIWEALNVARDNKALVAARDGAVINLNRVASRLCGRSLDELAGSRVADLFEAPPRAGATRWETALKTAAGASIPVEVTCQRLGSRLADIEVYAFLDLRERREAAEERERQSRTLQLRDEELRTQNARFDTAVDNMIQGLCLFDADQRVVRANRRYAEIYGLSLDDVKPGTTRRQIFEARAANGLYDHVESRKFVNDSVEHFGQRETEIVRLADGRVISVVRLPMEDGGLMITHEDITERETLNARLAEQKEQLNAALDNMLQGLAMFDAEQRLLVCNRRYAEMYRLTPDQVRPGTTVRQILEYRMANGLYQVSDKESFVDSWISGFGEVSSRIQELADGRVINVTRCRMANGGRLITHEDITEREKLAATLARQDERLRQQNMQLDAALNNMSQGLCMMDAERRLVVCNRRYAEMYKVPPELTRAGTPISAILEDRIARGLFAGVSADDYRRQRREAYWDRPSTTIQDLSDGRVIVVVHQPTPGGGAVATHEDITEQRRIEARMAHMAHHDALTGLPNRVLLQQRLEQAVELGQGAAVLCLDLDRFKEVNDTLGHGIGDALLKAVARRLRGCARETDTVARSSGDEFVIVQISPEPSQDAAHLAGRILDALKAPFELDGHQVVIGTSVGIAVSPDHGNDPHELLKSADLALYQAKARERGSFCFFEADMTARLRARRDLERDLRAALANGELEVHYQPIVSVERHEVSGFEALLRWRHPMRGLVSPGDFIALAEETGLIVPIGEWVLRQACADAATWPAGMRVAVNLSAVQFKSRSLGQTVFSALAHAGLAASRLEVEITESVLLQDDEATLATLHQLRDLGVRVALDDFGTGYSSLSYLRSFPFDKIKIDRCFVADLAESDADLLAIVRMVARLGGALGVSTTAEGVETKEQLERIRAEGCTEMQGYLFSAPKTAAEIRVFFCDPERATNAA